MEKGKKLKVAISTKGMQISVVSDGGYNDYISLTDIAFEFALWISTEFKLYIITDYQRLKENENSRLSLNWNMNREISKINYRIHTDTIKEHLIVADILKQYRSFTYATEADVLNIAMLGQTAKQWRNANPDMDENIRNHAMLRQLIVLSNMESLNAEMIKRGINRDTRLVELNRIAKEQMYSLNKSKAVHRLEGSK